jgi:polyhydroxyalkanoate synthesis regulator phasin
MSSQPRVTAPRIQHPEDDDLDKQADYIKSLLKRLLESMNRDISKSWEQDYRIRDLREETQRLKAQLRDSLPIGDPDNPRRDVMNALELVQERTAEELRANVFSLKTELRTTTAALQKERSDNWELRYQCQDLREEVWRLRICLSHSVAVSDWEDSPPMPKTAGERALEEKVKALEKRIRELEDKAWRREEKIRYVTGKATGRSRSMSM